MRTTFRQDLQDSPAEMVFGTLLRIPGEFFVPKDTSACGPHAFIASLRRFFKAISPVSSARYATHHPFIFKDFTTCNYVFCRIDAIKTPLEQPYIGPHRIVKRVDHRTFIIDVNGIAKTLSTDHLKPAYLERSNSQLRQWSRQHPSVQPTELSHDHSLRSSDKDLLDLAINSQPTSDPQEQPSVLCGIKCTTTSVQHPDQEESHIFTSFTLGEGVIVALDNCSPSM